MSDIKDGFNYSLKRTLEQIENELRSSLRYTWQKTAAFIKFYEPPIDDIQQQLIETFFLFIAKENPKKDEITQAIIDSFVSILKKIINCKDITALEIEDMFIEKAIFNLRNILI